MDKVAVTLMIIFNIAVLWYVAYSLIGFILTHNKEKC